jgi:hypothetical protein
MGQAPRKAPKKRVHFFKSSSQKKDNSAALIERQLSAHDSNVAHATEAK